MTTVTVDQIRYTLADVMEASPDDIDADTTHETLESWDSLRHMRLMAALEEDFGVRFSDAEVSRCVTVAAIIEILSAKSATAG